MIHQYRNNGYNIVLDVYSGAVHLVDDLCYRMLELLQEGKEDPTIESLEQPETKEMLLERLKKHFFLHSIRIPQDLEIIQSLCTGKFTVILSVIL